MNNEVKRRLRIIGLPVWRLADKIGVSENTLGRWLRHPLSGERLARVEKALREVEAQQGKAEAAGNE